jgi:deoxyribodipyrimidine photo-lyase
MAGYAARRDRIDLDGTSALSPYLRFGMLSPRLAAVTALEKPGMGASTWLNELIWRDFYISALHHFPDVLTSEFDVRLRAIRWLDQPEDIEAWKTGHSGYPVVDAAMRQMLATGWMHNRLRMIVASFLVKHLLVDWRIGEAWFMQQLVDGDPAANNGGWQWTAGVGMDAAPYFRVFNPVVQAKRFDPEGAYVRRWLPELASVPTTYIHEPWRMPAAVQGEAGVRIGLEYPSPVVDLGKGRLRALEAYRDARERNAGG